MSWNKNEDHDTNLKDKMWRFERRMKRDPNDKAQVYIYYRNGNMGAITRKRKHN